MGYKKFGLFSKIVIFCLFGLLSSCALNPISAERRKMFDEMGNRKWSDLEGKRPDSGIDWKHKQTEKEQFDALIFDLYNP